MLVIRRRPGESLIIAGDIEIEILESSGSHVKLGIRAPKSVPVIRKELQLAREQNVAASRAVPLPSLEDLSSSLKKRFSTPISAL